MKVLLMAVLCAVSVWASPVVAHERAYFTLIANGITGESTSEVGWSDRFDKNWYSQESEGNYDGFGLTLGAFLPVCRSMALTGSVGKWNSEIDGFKGGFATDLDATVWSFGLRYYLDSDPPCEAKRK
jgi:hypothetical protein